MAEQIYTLPNGQTIGLPADMAPEAVNRVLANEIAAISQGLANSQPNAIDTKTGAPVNVREFVGGSTPGDRLANIRQFYPEAVPYKGDNFLFYDRKTRRPTLYNDDNGWIPSVGDVASAAREGASTVGGAIGAAGGFAASALAAAPTGGISLLGAPEATAVGAGLGAAAGGGLYDAIGETFRGRQDSRSLGERFVDTGIEAATGAAGQAAVPALGRAVRSALTSSSPAVQGSAREAAMALTQSGIPATAGMVSGNRGLQLAEKVLEGTVGGGGVIARRAQEAMDAGRARVGQLTESMTGPGVTPSGGLAGQNLKAGARQAIERMNARLGDEYEQVFAQIGPDRPVVLSETRRLVDDLSAQLARAPRSQADRYGEALDQARRIIDDAQETGGAMAFELLRGRRRDLGKALGVRPTTRREAVNAPPLERLYAALSEDIMTAAEQAGAPMAHRLRVLDRATRINRNVSEKALAEVIEKETDVAAYSHAVSGIGGGGERIARLFRYMTPEQRNATGAAVLARIGHARPGSQNAAGDNFSFSTFLTEWNKISPDAKAQLFGGANRELRSSLDNLARASEAVKDLERLANSSKTAWHNQAYQLLFGSLGGAVIGGAEGAMTGAVLAGANVGAQRALAGLIVNPAFVRWLTVGTQMIQRGTPNSLAAHVGRLGGLGVAHPAIRKEIEAYRAQLEPAAREMLLQKAAGPRPIK
jgi:hypothetical protein